MAALLQVTPSVIATFASLKAIGGPRASNQTAASSFCLKTVEKRLLQHSLSGEFQLRRGKNRVLHRQQPMQARATVAEEAATGVVVKPTHVLFVCLGNICRSPSAEAVFRNVVEKRGLTESFVIDSAGMIDYHQGQPADRRMRDHAARRGVNLTSISRPVVRSDFETFDLILAMDNQNLDDLRRAHSRWNAQTLLPPNSLDKVKLMCNYCTKFPEKEVPDPYYGGPAGFEKVLDLLDDACEGLLDSILAQRV